MFNVHATPFLASIYLCVMHWYHLWMHLANCDTWLHLSFIHNSFKNICQKLQSSAQIDGLIRINFSQFDKDHKNLYYFQTHSSTYKHPHFQCKPGEYGMLRIWDKVWQNKRRHWDLIWQPMTKGSSDVQCCSAVTAQLYNIPHYTFLLWWLE